MSSRNRRTAELSRERMRAGIFERERGDAALHWVLPPPHPLRNPDPRPNRAHGHAETDDTTKRPV